MADAALATLIGVFSQNTIFGSTNRSFWCDTLKNMTSVIVDKVKSVTKGVRTRVVKPPFTYDALPDGHIRLLRVTPMGDLFSELKCTLTVEKLQDALKFYALSYVWGSAALSHKIICNNLQLAVTKSVYEALSGLDITRFKRIGPPI